MSYIACMCCVSTLLTFLYRFYGAQAYWRNMSLTLEFRLCGYFRFISLSLNVPFKSAGTENLCLFIFVSS